MDRDIDRYRSLTRRALVLGGVQLAAIGTLAARLYYLQVTESEHFRVLAEENRINLKLIAPSRGLILDRFGVPLAENDQNFRVILLPEQAGDVEATLDKLASIVSLTEADHRRVLRDVERRRAFVPITVKDYLSWEQVSRLEVNAPELPGLSIEVGDLRHYPYREATAHVLGYVGAVSERELTGDPLLTLPGFRIGKNGIEKEHEQSLRGTAGASRVEVNAVGRVIREISRDEGQPGRDSRLTLDVELQQFVQDRLAEEHSASAVIMDIFNGEIFALCSHPSFDPNMFATGISGDDWKRLVNDQYAPLINKAIAGQYAPGSTFKLMTAMAALEEGSIGPHYQAYCPGFMNLGNHRFHCWKRGGHGWMDMYQAVAQSCDTYFYDVSRKIGIDTIAAMARRFGLGEPTGIDIPGERAGLMPSREWKLGAIGETWQPGETLVAAIGQGYVLSTPLQLAVMVARLVNGGRAVRPHLTYGGAEAYQTGQWPEIGVSRNALAAVRESMIEVTSGRRGTARTQQIPVDGMEMAGKTGTSQVKRITMAERATGIVKQADRPWRDRHHGLFVAFAPIQAPRYAAAVVVEHGGSSSAASPIARDILQKCQERAPARPLLSAGPNRRPGGRTG